MLRTVDIVVVAIIVIVCTFVDLTAAQGMYIPLLAPFPLLALSLSLSPSLPLALTLSHPPLSHPPLSSSSSSSFSSSSQVCTPACQAGEACMPLTGGFNTSVSTFQCQACVGLGLHCPNNSVAVNGSVSSLLCNAGQFCPSPVQVQDCPAGSYCPPGSFAPIPCTNLGFYCPPNSVSPIDKLCESGHYCPTPKSQLECPAGSFCREARISPHACPALSSCPVGSKNPSYSFLLGIILFLAIAGVTIGKGVATRFRHQQSAEEMDALVKLEQRQLVYRNLISTAITRYFSDSSVDPQQLDARAVDVRIWMAGRKMEKNGVTIGVQHISFFVPDPTVGVKTKSNADAGMSHQAPLLLRPTSLGALHPPPNFPGKRLLTDVSTEFQQGSMVALMGASGCGKTTLLNVIYGSAHYGQQFGRVLLNGLEMDMEHVRDVIGFVPQDDVVFEDLTVRQNIQYSARLRLPKTYTDEAKERVVDQVINVLGLQRVATSVVGSVKQRGISGGQRKRVSIGMELVAEPSVLFMDEPTSGLDSSTARDVLDTLSNLARLGMTIVCVIHQPRFSIFEMFSKVVLMLEGGHVAYDGPPLGASVYFESQGFTFPVNDNPADVLLDILSGTMTTSKDTEFIPIKLRDWWQQHLIDQLQDESAAVAEQLQDDNNTVHEQVDDDKKHELASIPAPAAPAPAPPVPAPLAGDGAGAEAADAVLPSNEYGTSSDDDEEDDNDWVDHHTGSVDQQPNEVVLGASSIDPVDLTIGAPDVTVMEVRDMSASMQLEMYSQLQLQPLMRANLRASFDGLADPRLNGTIGYDDLLALVNEAYSECTVEAERKIAVRSSFSRERGFTFDMPALRRTKSMEDATASFLDTLNIGREDRISFCDFENMLMKLCTADATIDPVVREAGLVSVSSSKSDFEPDLVSVSIEDAVPSRRMPNFCSLLFTFLQRSFSQRYFRLGQWIQQLLLLVAGGTMIGLLYVGSVSPEFVASMMTMCIMTLGTLAALDGLVVVGPDLTVLRREFACGVRPMPYLVAKWIDSIIDVVARTFAFWSVFYLLSSPLAGFAPFLLVMLLVYWVMLSWGIVASLIFPESYQSLAAGMFAVLTGGLFSGVNPTLKSTSGLARVVLQLSYGRWSTEAMTIIELREVPSYLPFGLQFQLDFLGFDNAHLGMDHAMLVVFLIVFKLWQVFLLMNVKHRFFSFAGMSDAVYGFILRQIHTILDTRLCKACTSRCNRRSGFDEKAMALMRVESPWTAQQRVNSGLALQPPPVQQQPHLQRNHMDGAMMQQQQQQQQPQESSSSANLMHN
jgi:ABC-type multidrug transport system ATPase subunit